VVRRGYRAQPRGGHEARLSGIALTITAFVVTLVFSPPDREQHRPTHLLDPDQAMHIARLRLDWENMPETLDAHPQTTHPFEVDLDIVGERSMYRLLDTAVSAGGQQTAPGRG